jgi:hypothetical protein
MSISQSSSEYKGRKKAIHQKRLAPHVANFNQQPLN